MHSAGPRPPSELHASRVDLSKAEEIKSYLALSSGHWKYSIYCDCAGDLERNGTRALNEKSEWRISFSLRIDQFHFIRLVWRGSGNIPFL